MWLFISDSILHIEQTYDDQETLTVSAKMPGHIEAVFKDAHVVTETEVRKDERFHAKISRGSIVQVTYDWALHLHNPNGTKILTEEFQQDIRNRVQFMIDDVHR